MDGWRQQQEQEEQQQWEETECEPHKAPGYAERMQEKADFERELREGK